MKPRAVIEIHQSLCAECASKAHDPCATCAHGYWGQYEASKCPEVVEGFGLGDMVATLATPLARFMKLSCIDPTTNQLRAESGCAKRKAKLNQLGRKN